VDGGRKKFGFAVQIPYLYNMKNMILNIIQNISGTYNVQSFIIPENGLERDSAVQIVERKFLQIITEHESEDCLSDEDKDYFLEEAYYEDVDSDYNVALVWSN
jgi:hypothetical protein